MNVFLVIFALVLLGALIGGIVGVLARADPPTVLGWSIVGASGSIVAGFVSWFATGSTAMTVLTGIVFSYLAIATTSASQR